MIRVTQDHIYAQLLDGIRRQTASLVRDQEQISTGKKLLRPSDDPVGSARAQTLRVRGADLDRFRAAVHTGGERLTETAAALEDLSNLLAQAREIEVKGANSTLSDSDRETLAKELDTLVEQVMEIVNRRDSAGFLFAGTADATPFSIDAAGNAAYAGDGGKNVVEVQDFLKIATNLPGSEVFLKQQRGKTLFFGGGTGVKAGTGTDSGIGRDTLLVTHGATTYGDGALGAGGDTASGIRPSATSGALDTAIGPAGAHALQVDAVAGTISLNGGPAVSFNGTETDLAVTDAAGVVVRVDVTSVTAGFLGTVSIASTGFLSTDGGATSAAIQFTGNQTVVDSATGATTNVDTTAIRRAGVETVDYVGTSDLFASLDGLRDDLRNTSLSPAQRTETLLARLRDLTRNHEVVLSAIAEVGSRTAMVQDVGARLDATKDDIAKLLSEVEDADYAEVVTRLNRATMTLQLAQGVGSQILNTRLFDFLQ